MTTVLIVRPFGKKRVSITEDGAEHSLEVDFDAIHQALIQPALAENGLAGETSEYIAEAGNIRVDMFQMLITYDLVIFDVSIDHASVFYELGVRHGLRPKGTILIRFSTPGRGMPFGLRTDRCIAYDQKDPGAAVAQLTQSIGQTVLSMRENGSADSPVYALLPALSPPDPANLLVVPRSFQEAVEEAEAQGAEGPTTLALLGDEVRQMLWGREGLRLVGRAQRRLSAFHAARETWETVRKDLPNDIEANLMLATIYQRLGDNVMASEACRRVLENRAAPQAMRADARSQLARNEKAAWTAGFAELGIQDAQRQAISDQRLINALEGYQTGFTEDLNDYYSGLNALGLLVALVLLAELQPDSWASLFPDKGRASAALDDYRDQHKQLTVAVRASLDNAKIRSGRMQMTDEWLLVSEAQYWLLTADNPGFVRNTYRAAKSALGDRFQVQSEVAQVEIFNRLSLLPDNCAAAFAGLGVTTPRDRVVVATGYRVDARSRPSPGRFPNTAACIEKARAWLREALQAEKAETTGTLYGIAGAASGVDLLFHEVCKEVGIPTKVCLPIPIEDYRRESVADGGPDWVENFNRLVAGNPPIILSDSGELPPWAAGIKDYSVFQRGNIWVMRDALVRPNADVTLIALWNQQGDEGLSGGIADMVALAKLRGAKVREVNSDTLFGIGVGTREASRSHPNDAPAARIQGSVERAASDIDSTTPLKVFISYSHQDERIRVRLVQFLAPMMRQGLIEIWSDREIDAGANWEGEIDREIEEADIILLLVSAAFISSDYCGRELLRALERRSDGKSLPIPIILSHCEWQSVFNHDDYKAQAIPRDNRPIAGGGWPNQNAAFMNVTTELRRAIERRIKRI